MIGVHLWSFVYAAIVQLEHFVLHNLRKFIKHRFQKFVLLCHAFLGGGVEIKEKEGNPSIHKIKMKAKGGLWMILEVTGKRKERNGKDGIRGLQVKYRRVTVKDTKERFG